MNLQRLSMPFHLRCTDQFRGYLHQLYKVHQDIHPSNRAEFPKATNVVPSTEIQAELQR